MEPDWLCEFEPDPDSDLAEEPDWDSLVLSTSEPLWLLMDDPETSLLSETEEDPTSPLLDALVRLALWCSVTTTISKSTNSGRSAMRPVAGLV